MNARALLVALIATLPAVPAAFCTPAGAADVAPAPQAANVLPRLDPANAAPKRVELTIRVEARGFKVGEGHDLFVQDGHRYSVVSEARTAGIARLIKRVDERRESRGEITADGIRPTYFHQERTDKTPKTATFDWNRRELTLSEGDDRETVPLPDFVLDQTSLPYAFVFLAPPRAGTFHVHVTDGRRLTEYDVAFVGEEHIDTPLGNLDTLHYRKVQAADDKRGFEFWLSLDHYRLPVRVRIIEKDGTAFDSDVTRLTVVEP
ncbi:MAG: DUF3108 domain-containing protein [Betaproteobacteria bacterium]|nr:DUF3108 domain-containing protein [Betaproteobacteria bacterium]